MAPYYVVVIFFIRLKLFEVVEVRVVQAEAVSEGKEVFAWAVFLVVVMPVEVGMGVAVENGDGHVVDRRGDTCC